MSNALKTGLAIGVPLLIVALTELAAWPGGYFQLYYVLPLALLVPWVIILRFEAGPPGHRLFAFDAMAMGLAALRIIGPFLPMSGHVLFLVYTALTVRNRWYRLAAAAVFLEATYLKLFVWFEAKSWVGGLAGGVILGIVAQRRWKREPITDG